MEEADNPAVNEKQAILAALLHSFHPEEILQNITSAAVYYCAKGFDAFDEVILTSQSLDKSKVHELLEASIKTYARVLSRMQDQLTLFQRDALAGPLCLPQPPMTEANESTPDVDEAEEELCDQELAGLAAKILQVKAETRKNQAEAAILKQEVESYGNHEPLSSVTMPVATGKENLAESAEAIMAQAKKLGPLLSRAEEVLRRHQERKGALSFQSATSLAEKEFVARKAASRGLLAEDLKQLRQEVTVE